MQIHSSLRGEFKRKSNGNNKLKVSKIVWLGVAYPDRAGPGASLAENKVLQTFLTFLLHTLKNIIYMNIYCNILCMFKPENEMKI